MLLLATDDVINRSLYMQGQWEPWNAQIAALLLEGMQAPVVLDVGANLGSFAIPLARHIAAAGGVLHAFEAQRLVFYQLCGNVLLNQLENCHAHWLAIAERDGLIDLPVPDYANERNIGALSIDPAIRQREQTTSTIREARRLERVRAIALDALELPAVSLIKLDVEGVELDVLKGAEVTLRRSKFPPLLFECWEESTYPWFSEQRRALLAHVEALGYSSTVVGTTAVAVHREAERQFDITRLGDGGLRINQRS